MTTSTMNYYGLSEAARLCGVKPKQLLYWEEKNYIPAPDRIELGEVAHRQFSDKDLRLIRAIKGLLDEGFTLPTAAEKAAAQFQLKGGDDHAEK